MRLAGGDILKIKLHVEIDGSVDVLHDRIGARTEASAPHCVAHDQMLMTPMPNPDETRRPASYLQKIGRLRLFSAVAALAILIVLAGVYGLAHRRSNPAHAACPPPVNTANRLAASPPRSLAASPPPPPPL